MSKYVKYTSIDTQGVNVRSGYITGVANDLKGMKPTFHFPRRVWLALRTSLLTNPRGHKLVPAFCREHGLTRVNFDHAWNSVFPNPEDRVSALHARRKMNMKAGVTR